MTVSMLQNLLIINKFYSAMTTEDNSVFIQLNSGQVLFPSDSAGAIKLTTSLNVKCL